MNGALSTGKVKIFTPASLPNGGRAGVERERPSKRYQRFTGPDHQRPSKEDCMTAHAATNARNDSAQPITDPLILQARFVNEAAALDRALAMRKALRPRRSASAVKGWENRRG